MIYSLTVEKGVPEGLARSFRDDLRKYKTRYRLVKEEEKENNAAAHLLALGR